MDPVDIAVDLKIPVAKVRERIDNYNSFAWVSHIMPRRERSALGVKDLKSLLFGNRDLTIASCLYEEGNREVMR